MNASELKYRIECADPDTHFFDRKTMKFFGDTMANFGVCKTTIDTYSQDNVEVWQLHRKHPTSKGATGSFYFNVETYKREYSKH